MSAHPKFMVVIGASAGGLNALSEMVQYLEKGLDTAYCIVLHLSRKGIGDFVVHRLKQVTSMPCSLAKNGDPIQIDHIYVARPNQHLLVKDNKFLLGAGPEENRWRPSIDVLFRSAAVEYGSHSIGVILSGMLDDDGNLLVFSARNNVFKVNIETKVATHLGTVSGLPANFTINGAAVNDNNQILITSAVDASALYTVDVGTLAATALKSSSPWRTSDLANSNILRTRKPTAAPELIATKVSPVSDDIQLFPNPVIADQFNIQFSRAAAGNYTVQVTDASGQQVVQKAVTISAKGQAVANIKIPASSARGIYIVKVNDPNSKTVYSNKIVVQ